MSCVRIASGATEPIQVYATNRAGAPLTGKTDLYIRIRRLTDGQLLDWNDDTFKASGWTTLDQVLSEVDATNFPGLYGVNWDTSAVTNKASDDTYQVLPVQTPGTDAVLPGPGEIKEGQWVDDIAEILADTDAIDARLPVDPADESLQQAAHAQTQADIAALNDIAIADVQTALDNQGLTGARAGNLDNLDATVSSREAEVSASSRAATDLAEHNATQAGIAALNDPTAAEVADAVWDEPLADHLGAGSTGEALNSGTGAPSAAAIADAVWDEDSATHVGAGTMGALMDHLDADVSSRAVAGDAMGLIAGAVDANALDIGAVAEIADGVWDEAAAGHMVAGSMGALQNRLDATVSSRAAPGEQMDLIANAIDSDAVAASGAGEIADAVWDEALAGHALAGSAGEAQARVDVAVSSRAAPGEAMALTGPERAAVVDGVWDEALAGHLAAGTTGKALQDAGATADPAVIADAVWDESAAGHTAVGSMGQLINRVDTPVSTRAAPGAAMALQGNAVNAAALAADAVAEIADGVWDESLAGHVGAGSAGEAQGRLDAAVSTRAQPGDAMDLVNDAVDAAALATSAVDEIADQVWEEPLADHSGTAGSTAEALNNVTAPASPAVIADAVWDEALAGHAGAGSAGEALGRVDVPVSSRAAPGAAMDLVNDAVDASSLATTGAQKVRDQILSDSTPFPGAAIDAAISSRATPGDAMDLVAGAVDAAALDAGAVDEIVDGVWDEALSGHSGPGSAGAELAGKAEPGDAMALTPGAEDALVDATWDEPLAGHLGVGSTGEALQDAGATADPGAIADAVWDEAAADHTAAGSMGAVQGAGGAAAQIAEEAVTWPPVPGSLLDRLANKDAVQTYDQTTDSLEAIRDRVG